MLSTLFAFAYPGECARLMVAHPGIEIYAPITAIASLVLVWLFVWLLSRSKLAATISAVVLACLPAFRMGFMHPVKGNLLLVVWLVMALLVAGFYRYVVSKRDKKPLDRQARSRVISYIGLVVIVILAMMFKHWLSVLLSTIAAILSGLTIAYWHHVIGKLKGARIGFWIVTIVVAFECGFDIFMTGWSEGAFADRMAAAILEDMGDRKWIVTDGLLDDHLKLVAREKGIDLNIVSLAKDGDEEYRKQLARIVRERRLAGDASDELALSLNLGILQFVQDWLKTDPDAAKKCVIFGAADLWYAAGITPVPEVIFFGCDPKRPADWSRWLEFDEMLQAPRNWGSYRLWRESDPATQLRLNLRRHMGLVANNRGVWLQDEGRDDEAIALYRLVFENIDNDNVSAMFNILSMASAKHPQALALRKDVEEKFKKIVADKNRRYLLGALSRFYGYIRDPQMFVRLGYQWARSGMPGAAMAQIRRAIDLVPSDRRATLMNMLASLYASNNDVAKSRAGYESVLKTDHNNHEALIGLMRLSLLEGDEKLALKYLERAVAAGGDDPRIDIERAMVAMMRNDLASACKILRHCVETDKNDVRAWMLLSFALMQSGDAESDAAKKAACEKELADVVIPAIEGASKDASSYYVNTVKAFMLLRKGPDRRREARDALAVAAKARPDLAANQDILLGLDISLDDKANAATHARDVLKVNRQAPLANYVMGSLALGRDDLKTAEIYLKRAADVAKPVDLALNDLAETYRRLKRPEEAIPYAERAVKANPKLYVAYETLAAALLDLKRELPRTLELMNLALELSKVDGRVEDVRMYITLARAQLANGDAKGANTSLRKMKIKTDTLSEFERREYEEVLKNAR